MIRGGATLIESYEDLELYEHMDENTLKFAEKEIVNLISNAEYNNQEEKSYLDFNLIFCGDFDDLTNDLGSLTAFIINNKDKIVAVYRYIKETKTKEYFVGLTQTETINKYGYLYLSLEKLLTKFEENNVKYEVDTPINRYTSSIYRDDTSTRFIISYTPQKNLKNNEEHQLKKVKKISVRK